MYVSVGVKEAFNCRGEKETEFKKPKIFHA
jgi:hypothetical protein